MKNKYFISIGIIILGSFFSCKNSKVVQNDIHIKQPILSLPVTIRADTVNNIIFRIHFRIPFEITSNSNETQYIDFIDYYYSKDYGKSYLGKYSGEWAGSFLIYLFDNELATISGRLKDKEISNSKPRLFYIYTGHDIDTTEQTQVSLRSYISEMKTLHTDTLSVGSFENFKQKQPELTKILLEGDSIRFSIIENTKRPYNETKDTVITLPIRY